MSKVRYIEVVPQGVGCCPPTRFNGRARFYRKVQWDRNTGFPYLYWLVMVVDWLCFRENSSILTLICG